MIKKVINISFWVLAIFTVGLLVSCENKMDTIEALTDANNKPEMSAYDFEMLYSDSGKVLYRMVTPEWHQYGSSPKPYREYPKGLHVYFLENGQAVKAEISAQYVKNFIRQGLWQAQKNVIVVNKKGEKLTTEELFYDQEKHIIYSNKYCRVVTPDGGEHIGNCGLEAKEDFTDWKMLCPGWSTIVLKDESTE